MGYMEHEADEALHSSVLLFIKLRVHVTTPWRGYLALPCGISNTGKWPRFDENDPSETLIQEILSSEYIYAPSFQCWNTWSHTVAEAAFILSTTHSVVVASCEILSHECILVAHVFFALVSISTEACLGVVAVKVRHVFPSELAPFYQTVFLNGHKTRQRSV